MKQFRLSEIWIYPVKSLGGIRLSSSKVFEKGLEFDRRWMLVDEHGTFMSQRLHPRMALFKVAMNQDQLLIQYRHDASGTVAFPSISVDTSVPRSGDVLRALIWNDEVDVLETDRKISDWFSAILEINCRLVTLPESNPRPVDPSFRVNNEHVSLADAYPFLIIGQSSLDDLNMRLKDPVPMNRFRPNFVFTGGVPYEEETWRNFRIGHNRFVGVKPCSRCVLTTVDQNTGQKGIEPLATLSGYRKKENKVLFGQNAVAIDHTTVSTGDIIIIE